MQIDDAEGQMREQQSRELDLSAFGLHFNDAANNQVTDFRGVARV